MELDEKTYETNGAVVLNKGDATLQYSLDDAIEHIGFGFFQVRLIVVVGLSWMADAMEMMVLSILAPILLCEWNLESYEEAMITMVVFIGQGVGSVFWGYIGDKFGRSRCLFISVVLVFIFGIASSQAPNYAWILVLRFLVGFGIGGVPQAVTIATEVLPQKSRGKAVVFLEVFWAFGSVFAAVIAIAVVSSLGWRWYLVLIAIPILLFLVAGFFWLPESPRYLLTSNRHQDAIKVLEKIAKCNGKTLPPGKLMAVESNINQGRLLELFSRKWLRTVILLFVIWFTSAFSYYGIVLLSTEVFQTNINGCNPHPNSTTVAGQCIELTSKDYTDFMWTSTAEFPGIVVAMVLIESVGRKKSLALLFAASAVSFLLLNICSTRTVTVIILFVVRGLVTGSFQTAYVYTPEVLPTNVRSVGLGTCSMFARIGAMITPFIAQVLIHLSFYSVVGLYACLLFVCAVTSLFLTIETQGKSLEDSTAGGISLERTGYTSFQ